VLHECLTGSPPYRADSADMLITAHLMDDIPRPSRWRPEIPIAFDAVIARGMAKDPKGRYASAGELAQAANDALSARDQHRAEDIVERSEEATFPETAADAPTPSPSPHHGPAPDLAAGNVWPPPPAIPVPPGPTPDVRGGALAPPTTWGDWQGQFGATPLGLSPYQQPRIRRTRSTGTLIAAALAAAVVVGGLINWLMASPSTPATPSRAAPTTVELSPTTAVPTPPAAESQARLLSLVPAGYPAGACNAVAPPLGALAQVFCGQNLDPDGPPSGSYTLFLDMTTLRESFNRIVQTPTVVECPGRIQSPGAWHRNATPEQISGTLMCAIHQGYPTVAWTNDAALLIGTVQAPAPGLNLDQLYGWWMTHS
jgi:serine/threonine-protein kinase